METLKNIEVAELGLIKVNAKYGCNIVQVAGECIQLANYLKCAVELYFNGKKENIYVDDTIAGVMNKFV